MVLSTDLEIVQANVLSKLPEALLSIDSGVPWPPPPPWVPGSTKQVPGLPPYKASHSAASLICRRIVWDVGKPPFHVAVPIVIPVVPSKPMLLGLPSGRWNEKLSKFGGSDHAPPLSPTATVVMLSGCVAGSG